MTSGHSNATPASGRPLDRFKAAQEQSDAGFATALAELQAGRKTSHWIWYVFPQLAGLGRSATAQRYALDDLAEACAYLRDVTLRERLSQAVAAVVAQLAAGRKLADLMGGETDSRKLVSSLTLFQLATDELDPFGRDPAIAELAARCEAVLAAAEQQGYPCCAFTQTAVTGKKRDM